MVIVNLMGGLGNQLFQYCAGRVLANHHRTTLKLYFEDHYKIAKRESKLQHFNINAEFLKPGEAQDFFPSRKFMRRINKFLGRPYDGKMYRERSAFAMEPGFFELPEDVLLYGMWQSHVYADQLSNLSTEISLRSESSALQKAITAIRSAQVPTSIHIRRGDYTNPQSGFTVLPQAYYKESCQLIRAVAPDFTPVIFSDDTQWVKSNVAFQQEPIWVANFHLQDYEEMILMSHCKHNIIANSSFSWWGAYLNSHVDKQVVCPAKWHKDHSNSSTLIPRQWTQLQTSYEHNA